MAKSFVICLTIFLSTLVESKKILLSDLNTLTLRQGEYTTSRRTSPVLQLKCVGGCSFVPQHVQCYNRGSDGYDIQWECKTDMDNKYRFGKIAVSCEGYDYADDPYVLAGSCGLEYTIDPVSGNTKNSGYNSYSYSKSDYGDQPSGFGSVFGFICCVMIIFFVYRTFFASDTNSNYQNMPPNGASAPPPPPYSEHPNGPPPPYGFRPEYQQQQQQQPPKYSTSGGPGFTGSNDNQPGFFSGLATGGLLGYLFGNSNSGYRRPSYGNSYFSNGYQRDWFGSPMHSDGGGFGRGGSPFSSGGSSSGTRTASGFGGTKRR